MKVLEPWRIARGKVEDPEPALRYAWTHKISCSIIGMYEVAHVEQNVLYAKRFKPMSAEEMSAFRKSTEDLGKTTYLWWKR
jgi:predicted aldo/keto reductase-like oxidoreductase